MSGVMSAETLSEFDRELKNVIEGSARMLI